MIRIFPTSYFSIATAFIVAAPVAHATDISLASTMDTSGGLTEDLVTGSQARIGLGNGLPGDADGLYDINDETNAFGPIDLFPNEADFEVGTFSVDASGILGTGIEVAPITALDLSALWTSGSATTDVSDAGLGLWFFGSPTAFGFGALDATDTATFTDGTLTGISLDVDATFSVFDGGSNNVVWDGTFSVSGDQIALSFNDTQNFDTGFFGVVPSTLTSDLSGVVESVGVYQVPEPASVSALLVAGLLLRRRS